MNKNIITSYKEEAEKHMEAAKTVYKNKKSIFVKNVEEVLPIHITSGKYPTSSTEIMLPEHLYINGGVKYNLGDKITLELGQRMNKFENVDVLASLQQIM